MKPLFTSSFSTLNKGVFLLCPPSFLKRNLQLFESLFPLKECVVFCSCLQIFSLFFSSLTNIFGCVFLSVYLVWVCWGGWICGFIFHQIWEVFGWYSYEHYLPAQYLSLSGILKTCMLGIFIVPYRSWVYVLFQPFLLFCCSEQ